MAATTIQDSELKIQNWNYRRCLLASLAVAAFFLFFRLGAHDPLTDEEELAFRALGYLDFLNAPYQTTPYEWFAEVPWWVGLSFHDHPPLLFLMEHLVLRLFGDSLLAIRVPFAFLGLASLALLGGVSRRLYGETAACVVVALTAVNTYWLWIFRLGLQEGLVLFFLVAGLYCLTRAPANAWWLVAWGVAAGLGMLSKYTSVLGFAAAGLYAMLVAPPLLRRPQFLLGLACAAVLFSPVLIYNFELWRAVGHFDLQLAAALGQATPEWTVLPGKAIGTFAERAARLLPNLWWNAGWIFVLLLAGSLALIGAKRLRHGRPDAATAADAFVVCMLAVTALLVVLVGPSQRFLVMLAPFALLACGSALSSLPWSSETPRARWVTVGAVAAVLAGQGFVSARTLHAMEPVETPSWTASALRYEAAPHGYGDLEAYLRGVFDASRPAVVLELPPRLRFIEAVRARQLRQTTGPRRPALVVYDPRMNNVAKVWLYDRRYFYDGWPILSVDDYEEVKRAHPGFFEEIGIREFWYVAAEDGLFTAGNTSTSPHAAEVRQRLAGLPPEAQFFAADGAKTFTVYRTEQAF